jgi:signal transduction histidine kinase
MKRKLLMAMLFCSLAAFASKACYAEPLTIELVKQKVKAAAKIIEAEGESAFLKLNAPNGEFRFAEGKGYIWVHDLSGKMLIHPIQPELEGRNMIDYADSNGFKFFVAMNTLVTNHGEGWVVYFWPKPGKNNDSLKGSYVILVKNGGKKYVVGCGMYDINKKFIKSVCPNDIVYDSATFNKSPE